MRRPKHVGQPTSHPCVLMQRMVLDRRDRWPTRSHSPLSAQRSTGACNASNAKFPIGKQVAGEATCNASDGRNPGWWGSGELSDMRPRKREGNEHTIAVQLSEGVRRRHRAWIAAWGSDQTRQRILDLVCVVERSGFSVTTERTRLHHLDREQGLLVSLGTRMIALCRSVHWGRNWLSIVRQS